MLLVRETPLSEVHLEDMLKLSRMGVVVFRQYPPFYPRPTSIAEIVDHIAGRALDQFGLEPAGFRRWDRRLSTSNDAIDG